MSDIFSNIESGSDIVEGDDSIGGAVLKDSAVYPMTVKLAFITTSASGAMCMNMHLVDKEKPKEVYKEQQYFTSGTAKGGKNFYVKDGVKHYLPGYNITNALCLLTVGEELKALKDRIETKTINLYDSTAGKEIPTEVPMVMPLIGKEIAVGIIKQVVDKRAKNAGTGKYEPTGETREENEVDKLFHISDGRTVAEIRAGEPTALFLAKWKNKWEGQVRNRAKGASGVTAGAPKRESGAQAGTPKLFG